MKKLFTHNQKNQVNNQCFIYLLSSVKNNFSRWLFSIIDLAQNVRRTFCAIFLSSKKMKRIPRKSGEQRITYACILY